MTIREGTKVRICDGSEAHGDAGTVWRVQDDGIILVSLDDEGCIWPCETRDFDIVEGAE